MDRRQLLIAVLAVAAGCAAVVAVGARQRAARRAQWLAQLPSDLDDSNPTNDAGPAPRAVRPAVEAASGANDRAVTDATPAEAAAEAMTAAASEPAREQLKPKKRTKLRSKSDARRLADTLRPQRQQSARGPQTEESGAGAAAARRALALVGADPEAEAVWVDAINDPARTAHERQDLIEDLNEDGFPDPHHPTADDLPLIESRLALIEQFGPQAMDDVNAAAFAEAYKDLLNMYTQVVSESESEQP